MRLQIVQIPLLECIVQIKSLPFFFSDLTYISTWYKFLIHTHLYSSVFHIYNTGVEIGHMGYDEWLPQTEAASIIIKPKPPPTLRPTRRLPKACRK